jgi:hypothetical protein
MSPSNPQPSHRCLPRTFAGKNGLPLAIHRLPDDAGQRLIDMYLAFQPRNSFQGLPPIKDEVCVRWVRDILINGIHLIAIQGDCPNFRGHRGEAVVDENETVPFGSTSRSAGLPPAQEKAGVAPRSAPSHSDAPCHSERSEESRLPPAIDPAGVPPALQFNPATISPALPEQQPIIGHAALFPVNPQKCELLVVVCPGFQNLGIGTELVRSCIDLAAELGFERIWLPVDATNVRARHVYRKCGFEYVSNQQGRELDMTCNVRLACSHVGVPIVGVAVALPPPEIAASSGRQCNCHPNATHDLHGPAPRVPAPCFSFPEVPHTVVGR